MDTSRDASFREAFYLTTHRDSVALNDPKLRPRGASRTGPFSTYTAAMQAGEQTPDISDFVIDKVYVGPLVHMNFIG